MDIAVVGTNDHYFYETLSAEIGALGYRPVWTPNGFALMEEIANECPAVVFIDSAITVVSAYSCCSDLRRDRTIPKELPIFLLTDDEVSPAIWARHGFTDKFPKKHGFFQLREFMAHNVWK